MMPAHIWTDLSDPPCKSGLLPSTATGIGFLPYSQNDMLTRAAPIIMLDSATVATVHFSFHAHLDTSDLWGQTTA